MKVKRFADAKTYEAANLPLAERLELVEAIWDSIAEDAPSVPMPDWHREELDRRLAAHADDPLSGELWEVVGTRLLARLKT